MPRSRLLLLALVLALPGCLEQRLEVEITTRVHADGSCSRHSEYRLETSGGAADEKRVPLSPEDDPLRTRHRFPSGEPWEVEHHQVSSDRHVVIVQATLPAPCALDWDYWRVKVAGGTLAARNRVSFSTEGEEGSERSYDYLEVFVDPASPLAAARRLIELLARADEAFADRFRSGVGAPAPRAGEVKRVFRDRLIAPAARSLAEIAERGLYGPRERREVDEMFDPLAEALQAALIERTRGVDPENVKKAAEDALEAVLEPAMEQIEKEGLQLLELFDKSTVRFKATLIMPGPVVRANACIQGDTVTWEFDQDDLYGRGFEMWARAVVP